jgi:hypothetical protein
MFKKFRLWLAWHLLPEQDKFRQHYYLMFWQEACLWSSKNWRKVHKRALVRANTDFGYADETAKAIDISIQQDKWNKDVVGR